MDSMIGPTPRSLAWGKILTPAEVIAKHRWDSRPREGKPRYVACLACAWEGDTRNAGKTALVLHADHVIDVLLEEVGVPGMWLHRA